MSQARNQRPYNVAYYRRRREQEVARVRKRQAATLALLRDLRQVPCADCGVRFAPHQMDFDHRDPNTKSFRITAGGAMLSSRDRLMTEVAKCDVVCANCHRMRTRAAEASRPRRTPSCAPSTVRKRAAWRAHALLLKELRGVPCADCGSRYPPWVMDFDHRDAATKSQGVTRMVGRASVDAIMAEAGKCDIVCANCHRARTFSRRADRIAERE